MLMNRTLWTLLLSDVFLDVGFGLIDPILAIYLNNQISGATIVAIGFATTIFLITKVIVQLPFSKYADKLDSSKKRLFIIIGTLLVTISPIILIFATDIKHVYLAEFIHGVGSGIATAVWLGLWSRNLDKKREGFQWSFYQSFTAASFAISAAIGATLAQFFGFRITFIIVSVLVLASGLILFRLQGKAQDKKKK